MYRRLGRVKCTDCTKEIEMEWDRAGLESRDKYIVSMIKDSYLQVWNGSEIFIGP